MAWEDTLHEASFRGATFDCLRTEDDIDIATVSHEYPYMNGADIEDMGRHAKRISMTAVFFGEGYENRMNACTSAFKVPGSGELIHPVFGSTKDVQLISIRAIHDADTPDYCLMELVFMVATPSAPLFVQQHPMQKAAAVGQLAAASRNVGIEAFAKAMDTIKGIKGGMARLNALRNMLTGTLGAIRGFVQGVISGVLDAIDFPRAFAADLVGMVSGMVDLRGFDVGVIMSDWKSLTGQLNNVVKLPAKVSSGVESAPVTPGNSAGSADNGKPIQAIPDDVLLVTALVQLAASTVLAEAAGLILAEESTQPTLSPQEIEQIASNVRDALQETIDIHRVLLSVEDARPVIEALKDTAFAVQEAAVAVIEQRPPLVTRTVSAPGNLHLLAFRWYGDYTRAQELARLNPQLTNPNALQAGDTLYAYAR
ncbi:DNA circularization protein [Craterilacuibacter sinensis]|uniref:Multidrug DMT transporter permease n=1 Tax=Craterilacuibacter sinensis TaxID=2686017 RepID=A0A845BN66_9NEIS|nr:DNA circularization N-terminal domain-containing protein [Craterilacuibacter sinensis]MXR36704.1 multidrug DMT transporter permease [Craterilacuibacter sinensis]